jgi:hypothetical protein
MILSRLRRRDIISEGVTRGRKMRIRNLRWCAAFIASAMVLTALPPSVSAQIPVGVIVNGMKVSFPDVQPYIDEGNNTMVPIRIVSEKLNAELTWFEEGSVKLEYAGKHIKLRLHEKKAEIDGEFVDLGGDAVMRGGRTMVPLRIISEAFGAKVDWDNEAYIVRITEPSFDQSSPRLDAWGRLIRTEQLPGNAEDWPYILQDVPNSAYTLGYRKMTTIDSSQERVTASEVLRDPNIKREHLDQWASRIKNYYDLVLNVDHETLDPSTWWKKFTPYMNETSIDSSTRIEYAEWVKANRIRLEGWAEPEPSMIYAQDGNKFIMRTKIRFRILESEASYGVVLDAFEAPYEIKLKPGVWYSGYSDVQLSTNTTGNPWSHYGVASHDHMFFTPVANIREEV